MRAVVWADATALVETVSDIREYTGPVFIKVLADGGQNFLKLCLTILPEGYDPTIGKVPEKEDNELRNRSDIQRKLTGVKRLLMLCTVPDVPENHANMQILFRLTQLNNIPYIFVADFKLLLIVLGLQTAVSSYPCPYCEIHLKEMRDRRSVRDSNHFNLHVKCCDISW